MRCVVAPHPQYESQSHVSLIEICLVISYFLYVPKIMYKTICYLSTVIIGGQKTDYLREHSYNKRFRLTNIRDLEELGDKSANITEGQSLYLVENMLGAIGEEDNSDESSTEADD